MYRTTRPVGSWRSSMWASLITMGPCSAKSFASSSRNIVPIRSLTPLRRPPVFALPFSNKLMFFLCLQSSDSTRDRTAFTI
jgi:hypothetical protein